MAIQSQLVPIKVQCACGQRYAFDVEPVAGRLPAPVACPVCGADGTNSANTILAARLAAAQPAPSAPIPPGVMAPIAGAKISLAPGTAQPAARISITPAAHAPAPPAAPTVAAALR